MLGSNFFVEDFNLDNLSLSNFEKDGARRFSACTTNAAIDWSENLELSICSLIFQSILARMHRSRSEVPL